MLLWTGQTHYGDTFKLLDVPCAYLAQEDEISE